MNDQHGQAAELKPLDGYRLWVKFSGGTEGFRDYADMIAAGGPMTGLLRAKARFDKVYLSYSGPSWPDDFDADAINLQSELRTLGAFKSAAT